ncbi:MAG: M23 family metallopeptidase [Bacteroidales bacterium]|nr:M23 family metallopeptidase [Bacteroidales bacterium]
MIRFVWNPETNSYEERRVPKWRAALLYCVMAIAAVAIVGGIHWFLFSYLGHDLPKTAILRRQNDAWQSRMGVISHELDVYETVLAGVESRNDLVYRTIFALDPLRDSTYSDSAATAMHVLDLRLDEVSDRVSKQLSSLGEVALVAKEAGDMVSHIPAVPPILPKKGSYNLSSPFGVRTDPVYGGLARHLGQDFASKVGNPVYVTGDGVVEKVDFKFNGYGNEVLVNHGFGYKTRYAHLNTVDVGVGQVLKRGDKIGEIGKSGKATGPHLHYEVLFKGNQINPMSFMDMEMPVEEYRAMVAKRSAVALGGPRPTTASLGERQKRQGTGGKQ